MKKLSTDPKYIGGDPPGFLGVLHTWGKQLQYHPHIYYVVPGGALYKKNQQWHPSRIDFSLPVNAMSIIFNAKLRDLMKKTLFIPKSLHKPGNKTSMSIARWSEVVSAASNTWHPMYSKK